MKERGGPLQVYLQWTTLGSSARALGGKPNKVFCKEGRAALVSRAEKAALASKAERIAAASRAELYRDQARECEEDANKVVTYSVRRGLLDLAQGWRDLADQLEQAPSLLKRWWPDLTEEKATLGANPYPSDSARSDATKVFEPEASS